MTAENIEQKALAEALAWTAIQTLTARQVGICPITVRPSHKSFRWGAYYLSPPYGTGAFYPHIGVNGQWVNIWCNEDELWAEEIFLPGPVGRIETVAVDGVVVDPSAYRVDDGYKLVRQDGQGWPTHQDMSLPVGSAGTFSVTFIQGAAPDDLIDYAAGVLATEFWKAITGAKGCRLPSNVTAVTRQGVSYDMELSMFDNGRTGIKEVDAILARFNPFKLKARPTITSVDSLRESRRTSVGQGQPGYGFGAGGFGY